MKPRRQPAIGRRLAGADALAESARAGVPVDDEALLLAIAIRADGLRAAGDPVLDDPCADALARRRDAGLDVCVLLDHAGPAAAAWSRERAVGATDSADPRTGRRARALDDDGWQRLRDDYAAAAARLRARHVPYALGIDDDGLLHGALHASRGPPDDASVARMGAALHAVHQACGAPDVALVVEELAPGGLDATDGIAWARAFASRGARRVFASSGSEALPALKWRSKAGSVDDDGLFVHSAGWIARALASSHPDVEVHAVGRTAAEAARVMRRAARLHLRGVFLWVVCVGMLVGSACATSSTAATSSSAPSNRATSTSIRDARASTATRADDDALLAVETTLRARMRDEGEAARQCLVQRTCARAPAVALGDDDKARLLALHPTDRRARLVQAAIARATLDDAVSDDTASATFVHAGARWARDDLSQLLQQTPLAERAAVLASAAVDVGETTAVPVPLLAQRVALRDDELRSLVRAVLAVPVPAALRGDVVTLVDVLRMPSPPSRVGRAFSAAIAIDPPADVVVVDGGGWHDGVVVAAQAARFLPAQGVWDPLVLPAVARAFRDGAPERAQLRPLLIVEARRAAIAVSLMLDGVHEAAEADARASRILDDDDRGAPTRRGAALLLPSCARGACVDALLVALLAAEVPADPAGWSTWIAHLHDDPLPDPHSWPTRAFSSATPGGAR